MDHTPQPGLAGNKRSRQERTCTQVMWKRCQVHHARRWATPSSHTNEKPGHQCSTHDMIFQCNGMPVDMLICHWITHKGCWTAYTHLLKLLEVLIRNWELLKRYQHGFPPIISFAILTYQTCCESLVHCKIYEKGGGTRWKSVKHCQTLLEWIQKELAAKSDW